MKKYLFALLIFVIIIQILVPSYLIWERYDVLKTGTEVKLKVEPVDPYDAFRGRYVSLDYNYDKVFDQRLGKYGVLEVGEDGFAVINAITLDKPADGLYLVSKNERYFYVPLDRYYMEETLAPKAENAIWGESEAYVTVRIKGDKSVLSGLFIDGVPAEELLTKEE